MSVSQMSNVCQPNVFWQMYVGHTSVGKMSVGQMSVGKMFFRPKWMEPLTKDLTKETKWRETSKLIQPFEIMFFSWSRIQNFQFILNLVKLPSKLQCYITLG